MLYKYILIIILLCFFFNKRTNNYFSFIITTRKNKDLPLMNESFFNLNIYGGIKDKYERNLFQLNKTAFYIKQRTAYLLEFNISYNESNLITFQDKLNYLIIHESPSYKSFLADKIKVHKYSETVLGKDICVPIIRIYNNINEINFTELPKQFVMKLNHGSKMNIICKDKYKLNISYTLNLLKKWKNKNFGYLYKEFQYLYIKRKIFVEQFIGDNLIDYKIFCFNGEPKFIRIRKFLKDGNDTKIHNHYNINWELLDLESGLKGYIRDPTIKIDKPQNLNLMIKYAKILSQEFVFVRVDLYEVNNTVC